MLYYKDGWCLFGQIVLMIGQPKHDFVSNSAFCTALDPNNLAP